VADIANVWAYRVLRIHTYLTEASSISRALRISSASKGGTEAGQGFGIITAVGGGNY
jgi:hypothetical protein